MIKKVISLILVFVLFSACCPTVYAADDYEVQTVKVLCRDASENKEVLYKPSEGTVYAPITWLTYYGLMPCREEEDRYVFYYADQAELRNFSKRIYINKSNRSFEVIVYYYDGLINSVIEIATKPEEEVIKNRKENVHSLYEGKFSSKITHDDNIWVPIEELLPLLNASVNISEEGTVFISPNPVSIYQAISNTNMTSLSFDADEMVGSKAMNVIGYTIDTGMSFRFDRLDILFDTGRISDYEGIFSAYLKDDEAFLSAFDEKKTPIQKGFEETGKIIGGTKTFLDVLSGAIEAGESVEYHQLRNTEFFNTINPDINGIKGLNYLELANNIFDYGYTYLYQIEDHRKMLGAVYDYWLDTERMPSKMLEILDSPSYKAAENIQNIYNIRCFGDLAEAAGTGLRKLIVQTGNDIGKGAVLKVTPWGATVSLTKTILSVLGEYEVFSNASIINLIDNSCSISWKMYKKHLNNFSFDAEDLDNTRLCGLMSLVSSKHAYYSFWPDKGKEKTKKEIDAALRNFYLAAASIECESEGYYEKTLKKLSDRTDILKLTRKNAIDGLSLLDLYCLNYSDFANLYNISFTCADKSDPIYPEYVYSTNSLDFVGTFHTSEYMKPEYLYSLSVFDKQSDSDFTIVDGVSTGMTYSEISNGDEYIGFIQPFDYDVEGAEGFCYSHTLSPSSELPLQIIYYFDGTDTDSKLVGAKIYPADIA